MNSSANAMLDRLDTTIAAVASAPGPGLRGIIRVSGRDVTTVVMSSVRLDDVDAFKSATRARRHTASIPLEDDGILTLPVSIYYWPNDKSYTGEPMAEIHLIGSPPLIDSVLSCLLKCGAAPAASGEFTLRAFLNRRLDLLQAEAVLGVIDATDQKLLEQALSQLAGGLSGQFAILRERLLLDLADLEAGLDFVDEDIEFVERDAMVNRLRSACEFVKSLLRQADSRLQSSARLRVLLAGLPNAGKSSLFNALLGNDAALVSSDSGTTRDYLTAHVDWDGMPVELIDTAGWEADATGPLAQGLSARDDQWSKSHLILWCSARDQSPRSLELDQTLFAGAVQPGVAVMRVWTKSDLAKAHFQGANECTTSILDTASLEFLKRSICNHLVDSSLGARELLASTGARCRDCLCAASRALQQAYRLATGGSDDTLIAVELRAALDELGVVTGQTYTDDILDRIFSRFCIGK